MDRPATHRPVLLAETVAVLAPASGRVLLDATVGLGGHAAAWLDATAPFGRVVGLDRDPSALASAAERLARYGDRVVLIHADLRGALEVLEARRLPVPQAVLLDLGLGSHQLDDPTRGFSVRLEGPLDMRFDQSAPGPTAAEILARAGEPELARVFTEFGELRGAHKLARAICAVRRDAPLRSTGQFAQFVREVLPGRGARRIDPAILAFQALRIAVNHELAGLGEAIEGLVRCLPAGGRFAAIAFHSLEDRIVKRTLRRLAEPCRCRRGDPCSCGALGLLDLPQRRATQISPGEGASNPRARSARLRWGIRR